MRDILSVPIDGGTVLLHVPSGTYLDVNGSASAIVELLSEGLGPSEVARRIAASSGISVEDGEAGVQSVIRSLEGLQRGSPRVLRRPRIGSSLREVARWWALPARLRWSTLQAAVLLCGIEIGLRTLDVRRLSVLCRAPLSDLQGPVAGARGELTRLRPSERRMLWAIEWIDGRWLAPVTCLRRALVTGFALRRRGPILRLGITGNGSTAHAWIEVDGVGFGMEEVEGAFAAPA